MRKLTGMPYTCGLSFPMASIIKHDTLRRPKNIAAFEPELRDLGRYFINRIEKDGQNGAKPIDILLYSRCARRVLFCNTSPERGTASSPSTR